MYAGSRYAKNCHPSEFMTINGYTTSSSEINYIIKSQGLSAFEILRIDINCDGLLPHDYETLFLQTLNCAASNLWFNKHNNSGISFGTTEFKNSMIEKYNITNAMDSIEFRNKIKETTLKNHGVEYSLSSEKIQNKSKKTLNKIYGFDNVSKSPIIKQQKRETTLKNYGVEIPLKSPEIKEKQQNTMTEKYGVKFTSQIKILCPHCNRLIGKNTIKKYHLDNCKFKDSCRY
jgi:hypothetical protein